MGGGVGEGVLPVGHPDHGGARDCVPYAYVVIRRLTWPEEAKLEGAVLGAYGAVPGEGLAEGDGVGGLHGGEDGEVG